MPEVPSLYPFQWRERPSTKFCVLHVSTFHHPLADVVHTMRARCRVRGLLDIGYHAVITANGDEWITRPYHLMGSHTPPRNHESIGVCLALLHPETLPSGAQCDTLRSLMHSLALKWPDIQLVRPSEVSGFKFHEVLSASAISTIKEHIASPSQ